MLEITIQEIERRYSPGIGRHWFEPSTMRFFKSRLAELGYEGPCGVFFVSSEKGPHGVRAFSVRQLAGPGRINTIGEFQAYGTSKAAHRAARRCAETGVPVEVA